MNLEHPAVNDVPTGAYSTDALGAGDDPRVAAVLATYLAELEAGRLPSREEMFRSHPEIATSLSDWFDVVEFVHLAAESCMSDRPVSRSEDALPPDTILGEFRLVRELGRGGMGIVYEAAQIALGRRVALKVLSGTAALDPLRLQRFRVETQAVAQLNHPHIVPIFAVGSDHGTHFYAMQYIDGPTMAEVIHQQRRLSRGPVKNAEGRPRPAAALSPSVPTPLVGADTAAEVRNGFTEHSPPSPGGSGMSTSRNRGAFRVLARLAIQAAEALAHAHAMGILHRDIKPSNLLVDSRGDLWVTDFGLARFQDESGLTRTGDLLGTLRYMAPELVLGRRTVHDPRSDIYSLGATIYELLTLRPAFDGHEREVLLWQISQEEPTQPSRIDAAIPRDLETIVLKAMDKEPQRRYATAVELAEDLRRYLSDEPIRARRPTPIERAAKWARRHRAVLRAAAAVAFLALSIATPLLWWEQRNTGRANDDLRRAFGQADAGFEQFIRLSDELTTKGMTRYAQAGESPEATKLRTEFFQQAVEFYEGLAREAHIAKPMRALAYRRLGFARMVGTQDPRAADAFRQSIALYDEMLAATPRDPMLRRAVSEVLMNVSMFSIFTRQVEAAKATVRRVNSIDEALVSEFPKDPTNLDQLSSHCVQIGSWMEVAGMQAEAERQRHKLVEFYETLTADASASPSHARTHADLCQNLARVLVDLGRFQEGQEALHRALKLSADDPALLNDLAWSLTLSPDAPPKDSAEAIELAKRALAANSKNDRFWSTLGLAYLRAGNLPLAEDAVKKAMDVGPQRATASERFLMSMVCWRRGQKEAALDWYIQALDRLSAYPHLDTTVVALRADADRLMGRSTR
jgi:serine/threonine protein kinase